jgi:uncharacterized protein YkuJ
MYRICLVVILVIISGCQLQRPADRAWVTIDTGYYQLNDSWPQPPQQLLQRVIWSDLQHNKHEFLISVLLQAEQTLLLAISPLGQELWRIQYQAGHQLTTSGIAPFNQPDFAKLLLAQMQLAMYDLTHIQTRLNQLNAKQTAQQRIIFNQAGQVIIEIKHAQQLSPGKTMQITTPDYRLHITTLQQDFLP